MKPPLARQSAKYCGRWSWPLLQVRLYQIHHQWRYPGGHLQIKENHKSHRQPLVLAGSALPTASLAMLANPWVAAYAGSSVPHAAPGQGAHVRGSPPVAHVPSGLRARPVRPESPVSSGACGHQQSTLVRSGGGPGSTAQPAHPGWREVPPTSHLPLSELLVQANPLVAYPPLRPRNCRENILQWGRQARYRRWASPPGVYVSHWVLVLPVHCSYSARSTVGG